MVVLVARKGLEKQLISSENEMKNFRPEEDVLDEEKEIKQELKSCKEKLRQVHRRKIELEGNIDDAKSEV